MKNIFMMMLVVASLSVGCSSYAYSEDPMYPSNTGAVQQYGCTVIVDNYGERDVCGVHYYVINNIVYWYDDAFGYWFSPTGYWAGGFYHVGYPNGYWNRYHTMYHPRGWHEANGWQHNANGWSRAENHTAPLGHASVPQQRNMPEHHNAPQQHNAPSGHSSVPQQHGSSQGHSNGGGRSGGASHSSGHGGGHR